MKSMGSAGAAGGAYSGEPPPMKSMGSAGGAYSAAGAPPPTKSIGSRPPVKAMGSTAGGAYSAMKSTGSCGICAAWSGAKAIAGAPA